MFCIFLCYVFTFIFQAHTEVALIGDSERKGKSLVTFIYLTSVVPSAKRLVSMKADGSLFIPLPLSVLSFTGIQSPGYTLKSPRIELGIL